MLRMHMIPTGNVDAIPENLLDAEMIVSAIEARDSKIVLFF